MNQIQLPRLIQNQCIPNTVFIEEEVIVVEIIEDEDEDEEVIEDVEVVDM